MRTFGDTMRQTLRRLVFHPIRDLCTTGSSRDASIVVINERRSRFSYASGMTTHMLNGRSPSATFQRSFSLSETTNLSVMTRTPTGHLTPTPQESPKKTPAIPVSEPRLLHPYLSVQSRRPVAPQRPSAPSAPKTTPGIGARLRMISQNVVLVNRWRDRDRSSTTPTKPSPDPHSSSSSPPPDPKPMGSCPDMQRRQMSSQLIYANRFASSTADLAVMGKKRLSSVRLNMDEDSTSSCSSDSSFGDSVPPSPEDHSKLAYSVDSSWHSACVDA